MDRTELSEAIIQEVSAILAEDLRAAEAEVLSADLDGMEVRLQALSRRVCGAIMERVAAVRAERLWSGWRRCGRCHGASGHPAQPAGGCCGWWTRRGRGTCMG